MFSRLTALVLLGLTLASSLGMAQAGFSSDPKAQQSFQQMLEKANNGESEAQLEIASYYRSGYGVERNEATSRQWLEKAARNGNVVAMITLAKALDEEKKFNEAFPWFQKAAETGETGGSAEFYIGAYYDFGDVVPVDKQEAVRWYLKAAQFGHPQAIGNLANMYAEGEGVPVDYEKAMQFYQRGVAAGNEKSMVGIAFLFYNGHGVQQDYKKAAEWFQMAADRANPQAQFWAGFMLLNGIGGHVDKQKGMDLIRASAQQEYEPAVLMVAASVLDGEPGNEMTIADAKELLRPLAQKDIQGAAFLMGLAEQKMGNFNDARAWFQRGVANGEAFSAHALAQMYQNGQGGPKNLQLSAELYRKSLDLQEHDVLLNDAAWFFATVDDPKFRNPELALRFALRAVQLSEKDNPAFIDTLAESYYVNGDYQQAVTQEERAVKLSPDRPEFRKSLLRFRRALNTAALAKDQLGQD